MAWITNIKRCNPVNSVAGQINITRMSGANERNAIIACGITPNQSKVESQRLIIVRETMEKAST
jgi:hypothetical protein